VLCRTRTEQYGATWTNEELALGFVGDVGDLAKLVMAQNGRRNIPNAKSKLAHELADCLWSIIVLAQVHKIDLENAFLQTMDELEQHFSQTNSQ
jgi:NTP pyrophosphatase (non-canonical NTP hydrolase)